MEISNKLKNLYKHWEKHTEKPLKKTTGNLDRKISKEMIEFAHERMKIYEKKEQGEERPYTEDEILDRYRFCNVYRELDRQTIYFHTLLKEYIDNFPLWFLNMSFCRFICNTDTISKIGLLSFDDRHNLSVYEKLCLLPSPKYGNAYIFPISTIQRSEYDTREKFFCFYLPLITKQLTKEIEGFNSISVVYALKILLPELGFNFIFHLTEILIDTAYQYPSRIDLFKEFPIGPGSLPTMRMLNKDKDPQKVCLDCVYTMPDNFQYLTFNGNPVYLSTENWEGIGCEFRKYTNLKKGKGRKRRYI